MGVDTRAENRIGLSAAGKKFPSRFTYFQDLLDGYICLCWESHLGHLCIYDYKYGIGAVLSEQVVDS